MLDRWRARQPVGAAWSRPVPLIRRALSGARWPSRQGYLKGSDPPGGGDERVKTRTAPRPYQALGPGGRSPPRPHGPVRHRLPCGEARNPKRPRGIRESCACARFQVPCVHRPPTSLAHLQYGTKRRRLIGIEPPRAEPSAMCRRVASAPGRPACAPASQARHSVSWPPASRRTRRGLGHRPSGWPARSERCRGSSPRPFPSLPTYVRHGARKELE